ncbi:hypothetical protein [Mycoplasma miroungirhinis]|uniref:Phosphomannomutase n=1 Tax=Mycoplasma miroungirhinis TaxID=754516 RepID=A0A6M4JBF3_9MOLU|nr:hypothetical protein [Mycoplasma miroungirhinis]QJR44294.1 hypothetical protein HLA92_02520 [Mycoplasma miroungirhinis]
MNEWEIWLNYYQKNKKALKTIKNESTNVNTNFFNKININNSEIIGPCGLGEWQINEFIASKWASAFVEVLINSLQKQQELSQIKILVTHDGSDATLNSAALAFANVLSSKKIQTYLQINNQPVTKDFALFTLKQIKNFTVLIHFGFFSENKKLKSISFYQGDGIKIPSRFIDNVQQKYDSSQPNNIFWHSEPEVTYLNTELLLQEYVKNILQLRLRTNDKKMLKIGIIPTNANKNILTKVLGQLDFSYKFLEKEFFIRNDYLFTFKYVKELKNFYIIDFAQDNQKLSIYKHTRLNQFKKISNDDMIALIIDYLGLEQNTESDENFWNEIILSDFISDKIKAYTKKYFEDKLKITQLFDENDFKLPSKYIYINEDAKFFSNIKHMSEFNPIMMFLILSELLNYQLTQNNGLNLKINSIRKYLENQKVINFSIQIDSDLNQDIVKWLSRINEIAHLNIINKKLLIEKNNSKELFLFQFFFPNKQWLTIKLDKKENKLMFYFYITNNTTKIKEMKKFFIDNLLNKS